MSSDKKKKTQQPREKNIERKRQGTKVVGQVPEGESSRQRERKTLKLLRLGGISSQKSRLAWGVLQQKEIVASVNGGKKRWHAGQQTQKENGGRMARDKKIMRREGRLENTRKRKKTATTQKP